MESPLSVNGRVKFLARCQKHGAAREINPRVYMGSDDLENGVIVKFVSLDDSDPDPEKHEALFTAPTSAEPDRVWKIGAAQIVSMARNRQIVPGKLYGIRKEDVKSSTRTKGRTVGHYQVIEIESKK